MTHLVKKMGDEFGNYDAMGYQRRLGVENDEMLKLK